MGAKKAAEVRLRVPEPEWPAADRATWNAARQKGDIFGETGRAANWSVASQITFTGRYGRWLDWVLRARPGTDKLSPGQRVTRDTMVGFIDHLRMSGSSEVSIHAHVRSLLTGMLMFAPAGKLELAADRRDELAQDHEAVGRQAPSGAPCARLVCLWPSFDGRSRNGKGLRWLEVRYSVP